MKNILKLILGLALMGCAAVQAQVPFNGLLTPYTSFGTGSTNAGTLAWAIIGNYSANSGTPVITSIDATSDKAGSKLAFYRVTGAASCSFTNSTVTIPVQSTNNVFSTSGVIVIRHVSNDNYEKRILTTSTGTTNLVVTVAPGQAVIPGDLIYAVSTGAAGYIATVTNAVANVAASWSIRLQGNALYSGQKGLPLLMEVDATTTGNINSVNARFDP